jgi:DNA-directed RNA polymerase sigma subunit (sigma70/sigma32)
MARQNDATDCEALVEEADNALTDLSPHEELLLRLRFGIGGRRQPIAVISRRFGLQPQDLRDLENRALTHLRKIAIAQAGRSAHQA